MHPKTLKPKSYFQESTIPTYGLSKILQVSCDRCNKAIKIASISVRSFSVKENWVLYELVMAKNKCDILHKKCFYHKGQYNMTLLCTKGVGIQTNKRMTTSMKGLSLILCIYFYAKSQSFSLHSFLFFSFGKHHVVRKDLGTYILVVLSRQMS